MRGFINLRYCLVFALIFVLFACKSNKSEEMIVCGLLYYSNDNMMFIPCEEKDEVFIITDKTGVLPQAYKDSLQFYYTGEAAYAELKGFLQRSKHTIVQKLSSKDADPITFTVNEIIKITPRHNEAAAGCLYCSYSGGGNNATWTFEISEIDELITLRDNVEKKSYQFDYEEPVEQGDTLVYSAVNNVMQQRIEIKINGLLQIGELTSEKPFPVDVILNNKQFNGFAQNCQ